MTQYPIKSRAEIYNPRDGPTPENTRSQNLRFIKLFFKKALTLIANIFMKELGRNTFW